MLLLDDTEGFVTILLAAWPHPSFATLHLKYMATIGKAKVHVWKCLICSIPRSDRHSLSSAIRWRELDDDTTKGHIDHKSCILTVVSVNGAECKPREL